MARGGVCVCVGGGGVIFCNGGDGKVSLAFPSLENNIF